MTDVLDMPVAVRCEALFVSDLQRSDQPTGEAVREAVAAVLDRFGEQGCAEQVAQEFGDHPGTAVRRMGWCRTVVRDAFVLETGRT